MERYTRPRSSAASHRQRRFEPLDMNKSSSSLNRSTSSLRSTDEKTRKDEGAVQQVTRRTTTVRFAPPPKPSSSTKTTSSSVSGQQATARPATASGPRPGPRCRTAAGRLSEAGPNVMRSWGLPGAAMQERRNHPSTPKAQQVRSSSVSHSDIDQNFVCVSLTLFFFMKCFNNRYLSLIHTVLVDCY
jgi:hypothetical protein